MSPKALDIMATAAEDALNAALERVQELRARAEAAEARLVVLETDLMLLLTAITERDPYSELKVRAEDMLKQVRTAPAAEPELPLPPCGLVKRVTEGGGK
jgi:hypothetical protein